MGFAGAGGPDEAQVLGLVDPFERDEVVVDWLAGWRTRRGGTRRGSCRPGTGRRSSGCGCSTRRVTRSRLRRGPAALRRVPIVASSRSASTSGASRRIAASRSRRRPASTSAASGIGCAASCEVLDPIGVERADLGGRQADDDVVAAGSGFGEGGADRQDRADISGAEPAEPCGAVPTLWRRARGRARGGGRRRSR